MNYNLTFCIGQYPFSYITNDNKIKRVQTYEGGSTFPLIKISGLAIDYDTHVTMTLKVKFDRNFALLEISNNSAKAVVLSPLTFSLHTVSVQDLYHIHMYMQ